MLFGHYRSAWQYRNFIIAAIRGEFKGRYIRSKVGSLWHVLHPLAMAAIYAVVLSKVLGAKIGGVDNEAAYSIYLIAGIAVWGVFSEIMTRCLSVFIEYGNTLKKISFPRIALPLIILGSSILSHVFLLGTAFAVFAMFGNFPSTLWLLLPLGAFTAIILAFGLGIMLGILNVFARDVGQVVTIVLNFWFWMTPIVYPGDMLDGWAARVVDLNPVTPIAVFYQDLLLYKQMPNFTSLIYPLVLALGLLCMSTFLFRRAGPELVDVL